MTVQSVRDLICHGKIDIVGDAIRSAVDEGCDPEALLQDMILSVDDLEERLKNGEIIASEMLLTVKALTVGVAELRPYLSTETIGRLDR